MGGQGRLPGGGGLELPDLGGCGKAGAWGLSLAHRGREEERPHSRQTRDIRLQTSSLETAVRAVSPSPGGGFGGCELEGEGGSWSSRHVALAEWRAVVRVRLCTQTTCFCSLAVGLWARYLTSLGSASSPVKWRSCACPASWAWPTAAWGGAQSSCCCWNLLEELLAGRLSPWPPPHPEAEVRSGLRP